MSGLKELRIQKNSIQSIYQLTSAMKMVSAAKLQKGQTRFKESQQVLETLKEKTQRLMAALLKEQTEKNMFFSKKDQNAPALLVVFSADKSLCGGFNQKIIKEACLYLQEKQKEGKEVHVVCVGKKAVSALRKRMNPKILNQFEDLSSGTYDDFLILSGYLKRLLQENVFSTCDILYTRFENALVQEPAFQKIMPLSLEIPEREETWKGGLISYMPDAFLVFEKLIDLYVGALLYHILCESNVSEHAARRAAMDAATQNAEKMLKKLDLSYNRLRQSLITNELIEIISGALPH